MESLLSLPRSFQMCHPRSRKKVFICLSNFLPTSAYRLVRDTATNDADHAFITSCQDWLWFEFFTEYILDEDDLKKRGKSLFRCPEGGILRKIWWLYTWPIKLILTCLCPDPKKYRKLYPITFIMCIAFIGANSFIIVWMLTVFGELNFLGIMLIWICFTLVVFIGTTFKIPDVVMGLTFLSAGSAMPEALSSIMSVRKGRVRYSLSI